MTHLEIVEALEFLAPNASYVLNGDNYEEIVWHDLEITQPTLPQIETTVAKLDELRQEKIDAAKAAKAAAEAKLEALGLTPDDLKALRL